MCHWLIACVLVTRVQAFVPTIIRWGGSPTERLLLAPKAFLNTALVPQELNILAFPGPSPDVIPQFTAKIDNTITWGARGWCLEASGGKVGDVVRVNHCTGGSSQKWNWVPKGRGKSMIQLMGSSKCLDVSAKQSSSHGAPVQLRECDDRATESWEFEEAISFPGQSEAPSYSVRHVALSMVSMAALAVLSLGTWLVRSRAKPRIAAVSHSSEHHAEVKSECEVGQRDVRKTNGRSGDISMKVNDDIDATNVQRRGLLAASALAFGNALSSPESAMAAPPTGDSANELAWENKKADFENTVKEGANALAPVAAIGVALAVAEAGARAFANFRLRGTPRGEEQAAEIEKNPANPIAEFDTTMGVMKAELFLDRVPITASNFIDLAQSGFYNGIHFHRVIPGFMDQFGCPEAKDPNSEMAGTGAPPDGEFKNLKTGAMEKRTNGGNIQDENISKDSNVAGSLAMANIGKPNTGGSQFFLNLGNNTSLDWFTDGQSKHPVFGHLIEGYDIAVAISTVKTKDDNPVEPIKMNSIKISNLP